MMVIVEQWLYGKAIHTIKKRQEIECTASRAQWWWRRYSNGYSIRCTRWPLVAMDSWLPYRCSWASARRLGCNPVVGCEYLPRFQYCDERLRYNSQHYYPAWGFLAQDYLEIMSSSVSSKHAFSQGGITISKCCNGLKSDIVEALQCIKCAI